MLFLPRRHRRRLLLPPGLLALAWLLWLGCVAMPQLRGMHKNYVLQIALPNSKAHQYGFFDPTYASAKTIEAFRSWQNYSLTGNKWLDYFHLRSIDQAHQHLYDHPNTSQGIRVFFSPESSYASLIRVLNRSSAHDLRYGWQTSEHAPITLYVYRPRYYGLTESGLDYRISYESPNYPFQPWLLLKNWFRLTFSPVTYTPLLTPDWRNSTLLLLLLGTVSAYRLGRNWWAR